MAHNPSRLTDRVSKNNVRNVNSNKYMLDSESGMSLARMIGLRKSRFGNWSLPDCTVVFIYIVWIRRLLFGYLFEHDVLGWYRQSD